MYEKGKGNNDVSRRALLLVQVPGHRDANPKTVFLNFSLLTVNLVVMVSTFLLSLQAVLWGTKLFLAQSRGHFALFKNPEV